jgi:hypothetical protein
MAVIAEKLRLNDAALICGTLDEPVELPLGALDVLLLLPQAAATRAAAAATAVRAILLLLIKSNETTSFVGLDLRARACTNGASRTWPALRRQGDRCQVNRRLREMNVAINITPSTLK